MKTLNIKMHSKLYIFLKKGFIFVLILTLFSCKMNSTTSNKENKINNVEFNINKKSGVSINND